MNKKPNEKAARNKKIKVIAMKKSIFQHFNKSRIAHCFKKNSYKMVLEKPKTPYTTFTNNPTPKDSPLFSVRQVLRTRIEGKYLPHELIFCFHKNKDLKSHY